MKKIFIALLIAVPAIAASVLSSDKIYKMNNNMGKAANEVQLGTLLDQTHQVLELTYDVATDGGAAGTHELGISIPDNAIVTRSYLDILTRPAHASGSAGGSLLVQVESAADVLAAKHAGTFSVGLLEGLQTGGVSAAFKTTAARIPKVVVTGDTLTAGKVKVFLEYVVSE